MIYDTSTNIMMPEPDFKHASWYTYYDTNLLNDTGWLLVYYLITWQFVQIYAHNPYREQLSELDPVLPTNTISKLDYF